MDNEIWRDIEGYEGLYQVSNLGRIRTLYTKSGTLKSKDGILRLFLQNNGYYCITLHNSGNIKRFLVHRLVASAFIENPNGLPIVNHIDENKTNNVPSNLEWVTKQYNNTYGSRIAVIKAKNEVHGYNSRPVLQYTKDGVFVREYRSSAEAGDAMGKRFRSADITNCCNGKLKSAFGYIWKHKNS